MTGSTVLIKLGELYLLGKVRHSGDDVLKYFPKISLNNTNPLIVWDKYIELRRSVFSSISLNSEILETSFDKGFIFRSSKIITNEDEYNLVTEEGENQINIINENDSYLCSYTDFKIFIDLNSGKIFDVGHNENSPITPYVPVVHKEKEDNLNPLEKSIEYFEGLISKKEDELSILRLSVDELKSKRQKVTFTTIHELRSQKNKVLK